MYIVVFIDPEVVRDVGVKGAYLPLLLPLGLAMWYTIVIIFQSVKAAIWVAGAIIFLLILSAMKILTTTTFIITTVILGLVLFRFLKRKFTKE